MENQRIRLTKSMLKDALFERMKEKPLDRITVTELCRTAQINRTTFYKYYSAPEDVYNEMAQESLGEIAEMLQEEPEYTRENVTHVLSMLYRERDRYKVVFNDILGWDYLHKLFRLPEILRLIDRYVPAEIPEEKKDYIRQFYFSGGCAIIRQWMNREYPEKPGEIAELFYSMSSAMNH